MTNQHQCYNPMITSRRGPLPLAFSKTVSRTSFSFKRLLNLCNYNLITPKYRQDIEIITSRNYSDTPKWTFWFANSLKLKHQCCIPPKKKGLCIYRRRYGLDTGILQKGAAKQSSSHTHTMGEGERPFKGWKVEVSQRRYKHLEVRFGWMRGFDKQWASDGNGGEEEGPLGQRLH